MVLFKTFLLRPARRSRRAKEPVQSAVTIGLIPSNPTKLYWCPVTCAEEVSFYGASVNYMHIFDVINTWNWIDLQVQGTMRANLVIPEMVWSVALWYFCQCNEVECTEIVILPTRTGGLGWSCKDYRYAFNIFKVGRCTFKPVQVGNLSASQLFAWDVSVYYIFFFA